MINISQVLYQHKAVLYCFHNDRSFLEMAINLSNSWLHSNAASLHPVSGLIDSIDSLQLGLD